MNKETIIKDYQDYKKTYDSIEDKNSNAALQLMGAMNALEHLCPELKMSEDEKIKKAVLKAFKIFAEKQAYIGHCLDDIDWDKCIAWLENQGEQKPAWSEEDKMQLDAAIHLVSSTGHTETAKWLKSLKDRVLPQQKQEWSEEEQQTIKDAASFILSCVNTTETKEEEERLEELADKLQDLRPQSAWMPTPEQVDALQIAIENAEHEKEYSNQNALVSLMEDLKKL